MQNIPPVLAGEVKHAPSFDFEAEEWNPRGRADGQVQRNTGLADAPMSREQGGVAGRQPVWHDEARLFWLPLGESLKVNRVRPRVRQVGRLAAPGAVPLTPGH